HASTSVGQSARMPRASPRDDRWAIMPPRQSTSVPNVSKTKARIPFMDLVLFPGPLRADLARSREGRRPGQSRRPRVSRLQLDQAPASKAADSVDADKPTIDSW